MGRQLANANITMVSYVDKAANRKQFFLTKAADKVQPDFEKTVKLLTKKDDAEQLVYGVVYEPDVLDTQNDFMAAGDIEKAAHNFMQNLADAQGNVLDTQHDFNPGVGEVVESYVAPADFEIGGETIAKGSWVMVTKASDEIWEKITKGDITGYSMAGTAEEIQKQQEDNMLTKMYNMLKGHITKGEVKDAFYEGKTRREFWDAYWIFEDVFFSAMWDSPTDVGRMQEAAKDFAELLGEIADADITLLKEEWSDDYVPERLADIQKAQKEIREIIKGQEEVDVKKEDLEAIIKEAVAPITERLDKIEKSAEETEPEVTEVEEETAALTKEDITEVIKAAVAPLATRLEGVEKARGISKSATDEGKDEEELKKSDNVWDGLL